jgi:hypothetical protein
MPWKSSQPFVENEPEDGMFGSVLLGRHGLMSTFASNASSTVSIKILSADIDGARE